MSLVRFIVSYVPSLCSDGYIVCGAGKLFPKKKENIDRLSDGKMIMSGVEKGFRLINGPNGVIPAVVVDS